MPIDLNRLDPFVHGLGKPILAELKETLANQPQIHGEMPQTAWEAAAFSWLRTVIMSDRQHEVVDALEAMVHPHNTHSFDAAIEKAMAQFPLSSLVGDAAQKQAAATPQRNPAAFRSRFTRDGMGALVVVLEGGPFKGVELQPLELASLSQYLWRLARKGMEMEAEERRESQSYTRRTPDELTDGQKRSTHQEVGAN